MGWKMEYTSFLCFVFPALALTISILPNGNSPEIKMIGGMMVDVQKGFVPMTHRVGAKNSVRNDKSKTNNATNLSINERYRRLIPYMTFYYANDLATPTTESYSTKNVEVEKISLLETTLTERSPKKIGYTPYRNIPRYQGNRLTKYNIASANPGRLYKDPTYQVSPKVTGNFNPAALDYRYVNAHNSGRVPQQSSNIKTDVPFVNQARKPFINLYHTEDNSDIRYYLSDKEPGQSFKLIPYEQTPPVYERYKNDDNVYDRYKKPVPVSVSNEHLLVKQRPVRPIESHYNVQQSPSPYKKQPNTISESYYEKFQQSSQDTKAPLVIEGGFKPIISEYNAATESPLYKSTIINSDHFYNENGKQEVEVETSTVPPGSATTLVQPNYYNYVIDQPYRQSEHTSNGVTLSDLLNNLQSSKSIPKPITRENVGSSIKTLLQVLNTLRVTPQYLQNELETPILSTPKPFVTPKIVEVSATTSNKPIIEVNDGEGFSQEPYLAPVNHPPQHLDDFSVRGGSTQTFPLPVTSDDDGGTPGKAGVDYPILTIIPETSFDCKTQRYKGFFADPETRCQVWHYCDLNGGQASFLCPNGTIFSQAALTCDWWFNVRCASTTQLYVLNESLYKYILPHSPKFPEDYSGPLVDKYLTLKFKEMEEQFRKNKNKHAASSKIDSEETLEKVDPDEMSETTELNDVKESNDAGSAVSEASVIVETPGTSGNVERFQI